MYFNKNLKLRFKTATEQRQFIIICLDQLKNKRMYVGQSINIRSTYDYSQPRLRKPDSEVELLSVTQNSPQVSSVF